MSEQPPPQYHPNNIAPQQPQYYAQQDGGQQQYYQQQQYQQQTQQQYGQPQQQQQYQPVYQQQYTADTQSYQQGYIAQSGNLGPQGYSQLSGQQQVVGVVAVYNPNAGPCAAGGAHSIVESFTGCGLCLGICLFPIGLICCLTMKERSCARCGVKFA